MGRFHRRGSGNWEERWRRGMAQARLTRGQNEREDGAALKAERCADGQDPLDESAAALGLRSARDLPDDSYGQSGKTRT